MKRILAIACLLAAASALVVFGTGAGDNGDPYRVRAIFMNAFSVIKGEDVKIAGVKVGKIESIDVTEDFKAAVVLKITEPGYANWKRDASCIVRPQNLIGGPSYGRNGRNPEPLVHLGTARIIDSSYHVVYAEGFTYHPGGQNVGIVAT